MVKILVIQHQLTLLLIATSMVLPSCIQAGEVGICYGRFANNLPSLQEVVQFVTNQSFSKIRIFDSNESVIQAFANTNIELVIGIPNGDLPEFQTEQQADAWVTSYLAPLIHATNITTIAVGSEVLTNSPNYVPYLLPAMVNLHTGLTKSGLATQVTVTTAHSMSILQQSFPPSTATFNESLSITPLLDFLQSIGSYVMINAYPYHAFTNDASKVSLDYAMFQPQQPVVDPFTNLVYFNLLDAQLDALYYAMEDVGHPELDVVVSETGWPTKGDADEQGASVDNAETYNNRLRDRVLSDNGTPHRPNKPLDVYIFAIFDEDMKPGAESERNWGLYYANKTSKYPFNVTGSPTPPPAPPSSGTWCVARPEASNGSLADGINWACGKGGADCMPVQQGQVCYQPNTFQNHASYAFNSYYQKSGDNLAACNFNGTAMTTNTDPSYGSCKFPTDSTKEHLRSPISAPSAAVGLKSGFMSIVIVFFLNMLC